MGERVDVLPGGTPGSGFAAKGAGAGRPDLVEAALARARAAAALAHFRPGDAVTVAGRRCRVLGVRGPDGAGCGRVELEVLERGVVPARTWIEVDGSGALRPHVPVGWAPAGPEAKERGDRW